MDREFKRRLIDYFDAYDLVDLLDLSTEDVVEAFPEVMADNQDMLEDYMHHGK